MSVKLRVSYSEEAEFLHIQRIFQVYIHKIGKAYKSGQYYRREVWLSPEPQTEVCIFPANML